MEENCENPYTYNPEDAPRKSKPYWELSDEEKAERNREIREAQNTPEAKARRAERERQARNPHGENTGSTCGCGYPRKLNAPPCTCRDQNCSKTGPDGAVCQNPYHSQDL